MAQLVSTFCSRSKCKHPNVEFTKDEGSSAAVKCTVTLHALDKEGDGFPETVFTATERNKKIAKTKAMSEVHEFLSQTEAYKKVMQSPQVLKYCKKLGRTQYEQVPALAVELAAQPPPAGVALSPSGLSLRLPFADAADAARQLNPGFVEGGHGTVEEALRVVYESDATRPAVLPAVLVPVDPSDAIMTVDLPTAGHFRGCLAGALAAPQERLMRVATLDGKTLHRTLVDALAAFDTETAARAAAAAEGASKRQRVSPDAAPQPPAAHLDPPAATAAADDPSAPACRGKRDASGSPMPPTTTQGLHTLFKITVRCGDCYAALPPPDGEPAPINTRASVIAGCPVRGPMLVTRTRISGLPPDPAAPQFNGVPVTVKPVMRLVWRGMDAADLGPSLSGLWLRSSRSPSSILRRVPHVYDGADSWSGPAPQQLLSKALNAIPGAKITHSTSSISVADGTADGAGSSPTAAAEGKDEDEPPPSQTFTFAMEVSALGSGFAVEGTAATAAGAREAVALAALHKLEQVTVEALLGRPVPPESLPEAGEVQLQWEFPGGGPLLGAGRAIKGEVAATATVGGGELMVERCHLHGRVGHGGWVPAIEAALQQMRAGSIATLTTPLPFLGHDPTGLVERVPVTLRVQVAANLPGQVQRKVFSPALATQRHGLIRDVVRAHGCKTVVDYGCGEGSWIKSLLLDPAGGPVEAVAGVDESPSALQRGCKRVLAALVKHHAEEELRSHSVPAIQLLRGSVTQAPLLDAAGWGEWRGCDAAVACEVVEHVHDPDAFARGLLHALRSQTFNREQQCRPRVAVVSTPNVEYNAIIRHCAPLCDADPLKPLGSDGRPMRDRDHKFEWTRAEFRAWARKHAAAHGYAVTFQGVGLAMDHSAWEGACGCASRDVGLATQVAVFERAEAGAPQGQGGPLQAEPVFDTRQLPPLDLAGGDVKVLRAAVAQQAGGALAEGVDAMLDGLRAFDLADDDVND